MQYGSITEIVRSGVNILVQPAGPDEEHHATAPVSAQALADATGLPVRLLWHERPVQEYKPTVKHRPRRRLRDIIALNYPELYVKP